MQFSEKFKFPKAAYKELAAIIDNITNEPDDDNLFNLPEWFKKKHGIETLEDIKVLEYTHFIDRFDHRYSEASGEVVLSFGYSDCYEADINLLCEILAALMKRHGVRKPVVISSSVNNDFDVTKTGYGGVVYIIHPGLVRRMTTDDLAKQMLKKFF